jgi:hypothetical protein
VELGGFDAHNNELATQAQLLGYVSQYINAFWSAVIEMGMQNNVTLFTMSDFGRTLTFNGSEADHGWGNIGNDPYVQSLQERGTASYCKPETVGQRKGLTKLRPLHSGKLDAQGRRPLANWCGHDMQHFPMPRHFRQAISDWVHRFKCPD